MHACFGVCICVLTDDTDNSACMHMRTPRAIGNTGNYGEQLSDLVHLTRNSLDYIAAIPN